MDVKQLNPLGKVLFDRLAIIDVHKLGGDQPYRQATLFKPRVGQQQEVTVQPGKSTDADSVSKQDIVLKAILGRRVKVMVTHVGRIRDDQVEPGFGLERGEVGFHDLQAAIRPKLPSRFSEAGVQLDAGCRLDAIMFKYIP
jgi:hypothetical protein